MEGPGLYPTQQAPFDFMKWMETLVNDWDFDHMCTAHNGNCLCNARERVRGT
jgi:hypothetical protein